MIEASSFESWWMRKYLLLISTIEKKMLFLINTARRSNQSILKEINPE